MLSRGLLYAATIWASCSSATSHGPSGEGSLQAVYGPAEQQSEERAIRTAKALAGKHAGAIAWSREANPSIGEYGEPKTLYVGGDVPDME